jgi:stress-induced morphogen
MTEPRRAFRILMREFLGRNLLARHRHISHILEDTVKVDERKTGCEKGHG